MKLQAFFAYSIVYFVLIWISRRLGSGILRAGLLVWAWPISQEDCVHGAAGAAGLELFLQSGEKSRKRGRIESIQVPSKLNSGWLTLSILLLWIGWFGFNPGSVLAFNNSAMTVVLTTFLAAPPPFSP